MIIQAVIMMIQTMVTIQTVTMIRKKKHLISRDDSRIGDI